MDIVIASDNNYAAHAATLICSICENNYCDTVIHLFDGGISEETYRGIELLEKKYRHLTVKRYFLTEMEIRNRIGCNLTKDRSMSTYARIFIPDLLDNSIEKVLYLDADGIVCSSLDELFSIDMKDFCIAGVLDLVNVNKKTEVGLAIDDNYINAGVLLWNLKKCRESNIVEQFKDFIKSKNGDVMAMDQGTINGTLKGEMLILNPKWNVLTPFYQLSSENIKKTYLLENYYSQDELDSAINKPAFVHFVPNHTSRPWCKSCKHPLQRAYVKYRNMTEFKMGKFEKDNRKFKVKLVSKAFYILPGSIFNRLFNR